MAVEGEGVRPHRWYFNKEELANSPSRADGVDPEKELRYRQDAASLIQEMGPRLGLNPLCVSTAIVYMHRFYMINSFKAFDRGIIATAALFLAAKVEELPKKLESVAKCSYGLLHRESPSLEIPSEAYNKIVEDITYHELVILQTLGFDVQVKHPHPHVVECMNLVRVSKDLSQAAFFLAHNSQLLTTFCLQHPPTVVACMCIHLTCVWKGMEIPRSSDNKNWWEYVDLSVTQSKLEDLAKEFLTVVDKSPTRLKKRIQENFKMAVHGSKHQSSSSSNPQARQPNFQPSATSSQSVTKQQQHKDHHHYHHHHHAQTSNSSNSSKQQNPTRAPSSSQQSRRHPPGETVHRSSPPPPPPNQPHPSAHHHTLKHRKHKEHHNAVLTQRPDKHPLTDPNMSKAAKRFKPEDGMSSAQVAGGKQHLTLNDYRHLKKQPPPNKTATVSTGIKRKHEHSNHSPMPNLPPLPPLSNSHSMHHHSNKSNHLQLPPLPPPLPPTAHSPPPPPPPVTNN